MGRERHAESGLNRNADRLFELPSRGRFVPRCRQRPATGVYLVAGDATTARASLEAAVKSIIARRREIQFAADAQWPAGNPANAGIRREFRLSPDKAMK